MAKPLSNNSTDEEGGTVSATQADDKTAIPSPTPIPAKLPIPAAAPNDADSLHDSSPHEEAVLLRKLDRYLIPQVMLLYLFSFLDRVNIGNARLYKLESDLQLDPKSNQFQVAVSILFVTYLAFEVPSNLVLKRLTPRRWISFITVSWGLVATLTGLVQNYGGLLACRLILGAVEAGLFPGMNVYLTFFYTRRELALRVGYLFVSAAIAGAAGGLLAYGIGHMEGLAGLNGWRWIMIIEGMPTVILGVVVYFTLPNDPGSAYFLTERERKLVISRQAREYGNTASSREFSKRDMRRAFLDWKVWAFCIGQFGVDTMLYGFSTFLPTIINGLGKWTPAQVQLLTIPCYFLGAAAYMTTAVVSDRVQKRGMFCVGFGLISVVGYAVLVADVSAGVHYFGCFLVAMGLYVIVGLPLAWLPNNTPRYGKRTTANGMQLTVGNSAGVMAPFIYINTEGPRYVRGHAVTMSLVAMATLVYGGMSLYFARANSKREAGERDEAHQGLTEDELAELGDDSPHFRYMT